MIFSFFAAAAIAISPIADKWELKLPYGKDAQLAWATSIDVEQGGMQTHASLTLQLTCINVSEKGVSTIIRFLDLEVDGQSVEDTTDYPLFLNPRGYSESSTSEHGDDFRRMMAPIMFLYPDKPVQVGDAWKLEFKPRPGSDGAIIYTCEAKAIEKVNEQEAMKVFLKFEEGGPQAMRGDGHFWIVKDGRVIRYEMNVVNWVVPMAGEGTPVNAKLVGNLR